MTAIKAEQGQHSTTKIYSSKSSPCEYKGGKEMQNKSCDYNFSSMIILTYERGDRVTGSEMQKPEVGEEELE